MKRFYKLLSISMAGLTAPAIMSAASCSCSKNNKGPLTQKEANTAFFYFVNNNTDSNFTIKADFSLVASILPTTSTIAGECKIESVSKDDRNDKRLQATIYGSSSPEEKFTYDEIITRKKHVFNWLEKKQKSTQTSNKYKLKKLYPNDFNELLPFIEQKYCHQKFTDMWSNNFYFLAIIFPALFSAFEWNPQTSKYELTVNDDEELYLQISFGINNDKLVSELSGKFYTSGSGAGLYECYLTFDAKIEYDNAEISVPEFNKENIENYDEWFNEITDLTQTFKFPMRNEWQQLKIKPTKNDDDFNAIVGTKSWLEKKCVCSQIYKDDKLLVENTGSGESGDYYISDIVGDSPAIVFTEPFDTKSTYYILVDVDQQDSSITFAKKGE